MIVFRSWPWLTAAYVLDEEVWVRSREGPLEPFDLWTNGAGKWFLTLGRTEVRLK
jgi:hypothetical protein